MKYRVWNVRRFMNENEVAILGNGKVLYFQEGTDSEYIELDFLRVDVTYSTGLVDKNGKEVYAGDLLRRVYNPEDEWEKVNYIVYEVFFHDNDCADKHIGFQMNRVHFQGSLCGTSDFINFLPKNVINLEVIGNIYENPELLK